MKSFRAIEHIAKLEQRNAMRQGKFIALFNTHAVQSLPHEEREKFFNHLKSRKIKHNFFIFLIFVFMTGMFVFNPGITGNAIVEDAGTAGSISSALTFAFIALLLAFAIWKIRSRKIAKRFKSHVNVADAINKV